MNATDRPDDPAAARAGDTRSGSAREPNAGPVDGRAEAIVAGRLRAAAAIEPLPGEASGNSAGELAASLSAGSPHAARFRAEVAAAVRGTALALTAARPHPADLWAAASAAHPDPSVWFEQAVVLGHPTHPLARSRGELTDDEIRAFAPEHRARVDLGRYRYGNREANDVWLDEPRDGAVRPLLPVHPWQARRRGLGAPAAVWAGAAPLMSLRTFATGRWQVKTAVDLQLTSAVRHVSAASIHNGFTLTHALTATAERHGIRLLPEMAVWAADTAAGPDPGLPRLSITATDTEDRPDSSLAAIVRIPPHRLGHPRAVPLAALAEPDPASGRPIAAAIAGSDLDTWWRELAAVVLAPVRLFAATGVALEAHGQNTLVSFTGDRPTSLVYRDFGGVRVPPEDFPGVIGDLPEPDHEARLTKLLAALLPTTLTALVDALATWTGTDPGAWWTTVAAEVRELGLDPWIADAVLRRPWPIKATTAMRLAADPIADIWAHVANPLAAA